MNTEPLDALWVTGAIFIVIKWRNKTVDTEISLMIRFVGIFCVFLLWGILGSIALSEKKNSSYCQTPWVYGLFLKEGSCGCPVFPN